MIKDPKIPDPLADSIFTVRTEIGLAEVAVDKAEKHKLDCELKLTRKRRSLTALLEQAQHGLPPLFGNEAATQEVKQ